MLPSPFFWWQGRDGSRILGIRPPTGHYSDWQDDLGDLVRRAAEKARDLGLTHAIVCYGVGNHGGGPTKKGIASLRALRDDPAQPNAIFSTIDAFRGSPALMAGHLARLFKGALPVPIINGVQPTWID